MKKSIVMISAICGLLTLTAQNSFGQTMNKTVMVGSEENVSAKEYY